MSLPNCDEWTIDHWRSERRAKLLDIADPAEPESTPAFWKDLTTATVIASALWLTGMIFFG